MSLGYNSNRKPLVSNLPGSVGSAIIMRHTPIPPRRSPSQKRSQVKPAAAAATIAATLAPLPERGASTESESLPPLSETLPVPAPLLDESVHWVYATALTDAVCEQEYSLGTGAAFASAGTRLCMVYPMQTHPETGLVTMRCKQVDAVTGQLAYRWIRVYDPATETRHVGDFALHA